MKPRLRPFIDAGHRWLRSSSGPHSKGLRVDHVLPPDALTFEQRFRKPGRPVVLKGLAHQWEAARQWQLDALLARFGQRQVMVSSAKSGILDLDDQQGIVATPVSLSGYVAAIQGPHPPTTYLACSVERFFPELRAGLELPAYCRDARWHRSRIFLGAAGMKSPLHRDLTDNLFFQLTGRKRFWLYHRADTAWLYSRPMLSQLPNFSYFDPFTPDHAAFPHALALEPLQIDLEPGDALFLPALWWHAVQCVDLSLSLSIWWTTGGPVHWAARVAERWASLRRIQN